MSDVFDILMAHEDGYSNLLKQLFNESEAFRKNLLKKLFESPGITENQTTIVLILNTTFS